MDRSFEASYSNRSLSPTIASSYDGLLHRLVSGEYINYRILEVSRLIFFDKVFVDCEPSGIRYLGCNFFFFCECNRA